jgi:hypothetical protein
LAAVGAQDRVPRHGTCEGAEGDGQQDIRSALTGGQRGERQASSAATAAP